MNELEELKAVESVNVTALPNPTVFVNVVGPETIKLDVALVPKGPFTNMPLLDTVNSLVTLSWLKSTLDSNATGLVNLEYPVNAFDPNITEESMTLSFDTIMLDVVISDVRSVTDAF